MSDNIINTETRESTLRISRANADKLRAMRRRLPEGMRDLPLDFDNNGNALIPRVPWYGTASGTSYGDGTLFVFAGLTDGSAEIVFTWDDGGRTLITIRDKRLIVAPGSRLDEASATPTAKPALFSTSSIATATDTVADVDTATVARDALLDLHRALLEVAARTNGELAGEAWLARLYADTFRLSSRDLAVTLAWLVDLNREPIDWLDVQPRTPEADHYDRLAAVHEYLRGRARSASAPSEDLQSAVTREGNAAAVSRVLGMVESERVKLMEAADEADDKARAEVVAPAKSAIEKALEAMIAFVAEDA